MATHRGEQEKAGVFFRVFFPAVAVAATFLVFPRPARALHDQGYICYTCHSLNPNDVRTGSNSIRNDQNVLSPIPTPSGSTAWSGGMPITCDFCHKATDDVPTRDFALKAYRHPVRTIQDNTAVSNEIACGDCHNGNDGGVATPDLTPASMTTKNATDGYPNHDNAVAGYGHNLASNPPHLTVPYWGSTLPGLNRANDTTFWTNVRGGTQDIVCWVCHESGRTNSPTRGPLTNAASTRYVKGDYVGTDDTKGHKIRVNMGAGALGQGSALPCYDCHDSHGSVNRAFVLDNQSIHGPGTAAVAVTNYIGASRPYPDRHVCAQCHDTGNGATAATKAVPAQAGKIVEGMYPVDPYNSAATAALHISGGIADNMANSTRDCLTANSGCHASPHDPAVPCAACHGPGGTGPTVVWPAGNASGKATQYGSHLGALRSDNLSAVTDWNLQCNKCHNGHAGPVRVPMPPTSWSDPSGRLTGTNMAVRLGLDNYAVDNGIGLGGTATSGTTEADICWSCHGAQTPSPVSEWGFNTKTTPTGYPVVYTPFPTLHDGTAESQNYGWIYTDNTGSTITSDWTAGWWRDEYDNTIRRRIASVHSASLDPSGQSSSVANNVDGSGIVNRTSPVVENRSYIRCSYCHDVHDLNRASGDNTSGKPFLRGAWVGNPYPPELPPRSSYSFTTRVNTVGPATPRALSTSRDRGGYFIDQNSNNPTSNAAMNTLALTAGLCTLCHGTDVDGMKFYTGSTLWRTGMLNGHSNSTLGGTRTNRRDLFTGSRYGCGMGMQVCAPSNPSYSCEFGCDGNYPQSPYMNGGYEGQATLRNSGWFNPAAVGTTTARGGDYANWYGSGTIGGGSGANTMAHRFTCSKCHSPHATGLPVLLTHNCVDPAQGSFTIYGRGGSNLIANNCHRKTTTTDGWHRLAPGQ